MRRSTKMAFLLKKPLTSDGRRSSENISQFFVTKLSNLCCCVKICFHFLACLRGRVVEYGPGPASFQVESFAVSLQSTVVQNLPCHYMCSSSRLAEAPCGT